MLRNLKSQIIAHEKVHGRNPALRRRFNMLAGGNYTCIGQDTDCFFRRKKRHGDKKENQYLIVFSGNTPLRYYNEKDAKSGDDFQYWWSAVENGKWNRRYTFDEDDYDSYDDSMDKNNQTFQYPSDLPDPSDVGNWNKSW